MTDNNDKNVTEQIPKDTPEVETQAAETPASEISASEPAKSPGANVVGIRFRSCGKVYTFNANDLKLSPGTRVIVDSEMGLSMGFVVALRDARKKARETLKKVIRIANEKDFETIEKNGALQGEAKAFCVEKSKELNLPMKVVTTEITLDRKRLIFYFTADGRIDFRELVRDLASKFKTRIEMRQIGVRDEVKMLGGIGCCGRQTCCSQFLTSFAPITIRMAKQQELSINQSKLSGICGRLMCCLGYEYKDGPDEKGRAREARPAKVTEEQTENIVISAETGLIIPETVAASADSEGETKSGRPQQKDRAESVQGKAGEQKKPSDRDRRGRRRRRGARPSPDTEVKAQQGPRKSVTPGQPETKEKGSPFNKRKRFWKKKKKAKEE